MEKSVEVRAKTKEEEEFEELERAIIAAKSKKTTKSLGKLTKESGITAAQLKQLLKDGESCFENEEWLGVNSVYSTLIEKNVGPVSAKGRCALALAALGGFGIANHFAMECIRDDPSEASAYLAMAYGAASLGLFNQALSWFKLAEVASGAGSSYQADKKKLFELYNENMEKTLSKGIPAEMRSPEFVSAVQKALLVEFDTEDLELFNSLQTMSDEEFRRQSRLNYMLSLSVNMYADCPNFVFPKDTFSGGHLKQVDAPLHKLDLNSILSISRYLSVSDAYRLQSTCRLFGYWFSRSEYWKQRCGFQPSLFSWNRPDIPQEHMIRFKMRYEVTQTLEEVVKSFRMFGRAGHFERQREIVLPQLLRMTALFCMDPTESFISHLFKYLTPDSDAEMAMLRPKLDSIVVDAAMLQLNFADPRGRATTKEIESALLYLVTAVFEFGEPLVERLKSEYGILILLEALFEDEPYYLVQAMSSIIHFINDIHPLRPMIVRPYEDSSALIAEGKPNERSSGVWHFFMTTAVVFNPIRGMARLTFEHDETMAQQQQQQQQQVGIPTSKELTWDSPVRILGAGADSFFGAFESIHGSMQNNQLVMEVEYASGQLLTFEGFFAHHMMGGVVRDSEDRVMNWVAIRSSLPEFDDEAHVNEILKNLADEAIANNPTGEQLAFMLDGLDHDRYFLNILLTATAPSLSWHTPKERLVHFLQRLTDANLVTPRGDDQGIDGAILKRGEHESLEKFKIRWKVFLSVHSIGAEIRSQIVHADEDLYTQEPPANESLAEQQSRAILWSFNLAYSPLLLTDTVTEGPHNVFRFISNQYSLEPTLQDQLNLGTDQHHDASDIGSPYDSGELDSNEDDNYIAKADGIFTFLRRRSARTNALVVGSVAALIGIVGAFAASYFFVRRRKSSP